MRGSGKNPCRVRHGKDAVFALSCGQTPSFPCRTRGKKWYPNFPGKPRAIAAGVSARKTRGVRNVSLPFLTFFALNTYALCWELRGLPTEVFYVPRYFPLPFVFRVKARRNTRGNLCFFVAFYSRNPHGLARCTQQATMPPTSSFIAARVGAPPQDKPQQGIYAESVRFRRLPFHLQFSAARFFRTFPPSPVS